MNPQHTPKVHFHVLEMIWIRLIICRSNMLISFVHCKDFFINLWERLIYLRKMKNDLFPNDSFFLMGKSQVWRVYSFMVKNHGSFSRWSIRIQCARVKWRRYFDLSTAFVNNSQITHFNFIRAQRILTNHLIREPCANLKINLRSFIVRAKAPKQWGKYNFELG